MPSIIFRSRHTQWRLVAIVTLAMTSRVLANGRVTSPQYLPDVVSISASSRSNGTILIGYLMEQLTPPYDFGALSMAVNTMQASGFLSDYNVSVAIGLINCQQDNGTYAGLRLLSTFNVDVIVGPSCPLVCLTVGYLAAYWMKLLLPTNCRDHIFDSTVVYPTVMRSAGSWTTIGEVIQLVMQQYGWHKAVLLSDTNASQPICSYGATSINSWFMNPDDTAVASYSIFYIAMADEPKADDIDSYLDTISQQSHLVIFCHSNPSVGGSFIAAAQDRGMMNGQYAFFTYTDFVTNGFFQPWKNMFSSVAVKEYARRMEAFYSVKQISVSDLNGADAVRFLNDVATASSRPPWNLDSTVTPSILSPYLYDAISIFFQVGDYIQRKGGSIRDAAAIFNATKGYVFEGASGRCAFNDNSDRVNNYAVYAFRPGGTSYYEYMTIVLTQTPYKVTKTADVVWGYSATVPPDIPACGLHNELCPAAGSPIALQVGVSMGVVGAAVAVVLALFVRYRLKQLSEKQMAWKIDANEIVYSHSSKSGLSTRSNLNAFQSRSTTEFTDDTGVSDGLKATYRGQHVHVHKIRNRRELKLKRLELVEIVNLKELNHDNILPFIGASTETDNICYLTLYCNRGTIQNILEDDDIALDMVFKMSMISDIINGMQFLHKSPFQTHGHLTSHYCHFDNRWVVKIGGLAKRCFYPELALPKLGEEINYGEMLWTSPELLRTAYTRPPNGTQKGDVYSFAILVQQILYRAQPYFCEYVEPKVIVELVMSRPTDQPCYRPTPPSDYNNLELNPKLEALMKQCWAEDPSNRPTFSELVVTLRRINNGRKIDIVSSVLQKLEKYADNLEQTVRQRTTELEGEKQKTDLLLFRMLPAMVVDELKAGRTVAPRFYESATVYFSDIVDYDRLTSESTPLEVVDLLNDLYNMFDDVILRYDVYKVETIADSYMVVSGLPEVNNGRHVCEISNLALSLLNEVHSFKIRHRPNEILKLRIGIHTGPCAAGVIGHAMPRYCLFGDTVNVASRMESTGEALKIHLSQWAHEALLKYPGYVTEPRGETFVKGKGMLQTFWLCRRDDMQIGPSHQKVPITVHKVPTIAVARPIKEKARP